MKISTNITFLLVSIIISTTTFSCKKESEEDKEVAYEELPEAKPEDVIALDANDSVIAQFTHVYTVVHTEVSNVEEQAFKTSDLASLQLDQDTCVKLTYEVDSTDKENKFFKKVTIDYGANTSTWNGKSKKGKIHISKTGRLSKIGTISTVTLENFYISGNKLEGTLVLENLGFDGSLNIKYDVAGGKLIIPASGTNITYELEANLILSVYPSTEGYKIFSKGSSTGSNSGGKYSIKITKDLLFTTDCHYIKQGTYTITSQYYPEVLVDFGDGNCDDKSTVTIGEKKYKHKLP